MCAVRALGLVLVSVAAGLLVACCGTGHRRAVLPPRPREPGPTRVEQVARPSTCATRRPVPYDYGWPVRPFHVQHPVRANFGDPRTISTEKLGLDTSGDPGDYSFHNGVDISAAPGTPVYPVVSGIAQVRNADEVLVHVPGGLRNFQYWHIRPLVHTGQQVKAFRTVLGVVLDPARHVHLTEIDGDHVTNPARHLTPYDDHTAPTVATLSLLGPTGRQLDPASVRGRVSLVAEAFDTPPVPVPGNWRGFPVTAALLRWTLVDRAGQVAVGPRTTADFRQFEPPKRLFWTVYAGGTYQNFPVFDHRFFFRHPGRYLFRLTRRPLDTRRLANGVYEVRVVATDLCGNRGTLIQKVRIAN